MREKIRLVSSAGTGHFYTTLRKKVPGAAKLEMKKYDPVVRKHVMYKESKIWTRYLGWKIWTGEILLSFFYGIDYTTPHLTVTEPESTLI